MSRPHAVELSATTADSAADLAGLDDGRPHRGRDHPRAVLAVVLLGLFMAVLDTTVVNVAAPTVRADLAASASALEFAVSGYTLSYAVLLILGARLGARHGHSVLFRAGLVGFTVSSLLCGVAPSAWTLVGFRILQGAGAALMMPQVMSLIQRTFTGAGRQRALSLFAAVTACAAVLGQVAGGLLVSADLFALGWRPVFLINVPIGVVLIVLASRCLPHDAGNPARRLDPAGTVTLAVATLLLVLPLILGHQQGWPWWTVVSLLGSVAAFGAFLVVERRVDARGGAAILPRALLRTRLLALGATTLFVAMMMYSANLFVMALHLQAGLGFTAAHAGLVFAPQAAAFGVVSLTWQRFPVRLRARIITVGFVVGTFAQLAAVGTLREGRSGGIALELALLVLGAGLGAAMGPLMGVTLAGVAPADAADASAVVSTVFQLGQVVGIATLGTLYLSLVHQPGAAMSAHAYTVSASAIAGCSLIAAVLSWLLIRPVGRRAPSSRGRT